MINTIFTCQQNKYLKYIILIILSLFADGCHQGCHNEVQTDAGSAGSKTKRGKSTFFLLK